MMRNHPKWVVAEGALGMRDAGSRRQSAPRRRDDALKRWKRQRTRSSVVLARSEASARPRGRLPVVEAQGGMRKAQMRPWGRERRDELLERVAMSSAAKITASEALELPEEVDGVVEEAWAMLDDAAAAVRS